MAPHHAFLFDAPVRYVLGGGALASAIWAFGFAAKDPEPIVHAEEFDAKGKKKVIVRTHSGQIPPGLTGAETEDGYHERLAKTNFGRSGGTGAYASCATSPVTMTSASMKSSTSVSANALRYGTKKRSTLKRLECIGSWSHSLCRIVWLVRQLALLMDCP